MDGCTRSHSHPPKKKNPQNARDERDFDVVEVNERKFGAFRLPTPNVKQEAYVAARNAAADYFEGPDGLNIFLGFGCFHPIPKMSPFFTQQSIPRLDAPRVQSTMMATRCTETTMVRRAGRRVSLLWRPTADQARRVRAAWRVEWLVIVGEGGGGRGIRCRCDPFNLGGFCADLVDPSSLLAITQVRRRRERGRPRFRRPTSTGSTRRLRAIPATTSFTSTRLAPARLVGWLVGLVATFSCYLLSAIESLTPCWRPALLLDVVLLLEHMFLA